MFASPQVAPTNEKQPEEHGIQSAFRQFSPLRSYSRKRRSGRGQEIRLSQEQIDTLHNRAKETIRQFGSRVVSKRSLKSIEEDFARCARRASLKSGHIGLAWIRKSLKEETPSMEALEDLAMDVRANFKSSGRPMRSNDRVFLERNAL